MTQPQHLSFFKWDWKEDVPLDDIGEAVQDLSGGAVRIVEMDTGSDYRAVFVVPINVTDEDVQKVWARLHGQDDG